MSSMNYDVYAAFKSAGVGDEEARKAAEALSMAATDKRLLRIELSLGGIFILLVPVFLRVMGIA